MLDRFASPLSRIVSVLLLFATGLPTALELATHHRDVIAVGQDHLEAASVSHHSDDCLASVSQSPRSISVGHLSHVISLDAGRAASPPVVTDVVGHEPRQPTRSRAPPSPVA